MDYEIYVQRLITEKMTVKADSTSKAMTIAAQKADSEDDMSPAVRLAHIAGDGEISYRWGTRFDWGVINTPERGSGDPRQELAKQLHLEITKIYTFVQYVASFLTAEDIAYEHEITVDDAFDSRDFVDEYKGFMGVIREARALLDLPPSTLGLEVALTSSQQLDAASAAPSIHRGE